MLESIRDLAIRVGADLDTVIAYAANLGLADDNGTTGADTLLWEEEAEQLAYYFTTDPTPQEQYRAADGAPDTPWQEN